MSIRLYNSLSQQKEILQPLEPGKVRMYVCGPTVWSTIHIGNARTFLFFDVVRRYLEYKGYEVQYVENFTDVDDKLIRKAKELNWSVPEVAEHYIQAFFEDIDDLGVRRADAHPRVMAHIPDIIQLIERLVEKGVAYAVDGNVYFRIAAFPEYGKLSHQSVEELMAGSRVEVDEKKKDPLDFALWKKAKTEEIAWESPWGRGRPGWHIECSAMAMKYLGETLDIHGGGIDLRFPHHENEIAQSETLTNKPFARYWMHVGHLTVQDEKMSKSVGNVLDVREVKKKVRPEVMRFWMLSADYRSPIQYSEEVLVQAAQGLARIEQTWRSLVHRLQSERGSRGKEGFMDEELLQEGEGLQRLNLQTWEARFQVAMDDDFNTPNAIAVLFDAVKEVNRTLAQEAVDFSRLIAWQYLLWNWGGEVLGILSPEQEHEAEASRRLHRHYAGGAGEPGCEKAHGEKAAGTPVHIPARNAKNADGSGHQQLHDPGDVDVTGRIQIQNTKDGENLQIEHLIWEREEARKKQDYQTSDRIRDQLKDIGIVVEDTPQGTRWYRKSSKD